MMPIFLPEEKLKVGVEMLFTTFTDVGIRDMPSYRFVIGPTIAWKPTRNTRLDVSPLFGATDDSPKASVFVVFSMLFGPPGASEAEHGEAPASTRNRLKRFTFYAALVAGVAAATSTFLFVRVG